MTDMLKSTLLLRQHSLYAFSAFAVFTHLLVARQNSTKRGTQG